MRSPASPWRAPTEPIGASPIDLSSKWAMVGRVQRTAGRSAVPLRLETMARSTFRQCVTLGVGSFVLVVVAVSCGGRIEGAEDLSESQCLELSAAGACAKPSCRQYVVSSCKPSSRGDFGCEVAEDRDPCSPNRYEMCANAGETCQRVPLDKCSSDPLAVGKTLGVCWPGAK